MKMETSQTRRRVLRALIERSYDGVARRFAMAVKKPDGQINDMLAAEPRKAFGEKVARSMEQTLGLPAGYFDDPANACGANATPFRLKEPKPAEYRTGPIADVVEIMLGLEEPEQLQILGAARMIQHEHRRALLDQEGTAG